MAEYPLQRSLDRSEVDPRYDLIELNENNLQRVIGWVAVADTKAGFILSITLLLIGYGVRQVGPVVTGARSLYKLGVYVPLAFWAGCFVAAIACLSLCLLFVLKVIYPKRNGATGKQSVFYYNTIVNMDVVEFERRMTSLTTEEILSNLADQTYNNAKVVTQKFSELSVGMRWFGAGLIFLSSFLTITEIVTACYLSH